MTEETRIADGATTRAAVPETVGAPVDGTPVRGPEEVIQLVGETFTVSRLRRRTGGVRVATRTEVTETDVEVELERHRVEVTRVPVGRVVQEAPAARTEGDVTVFPVVEERLVVVKQLFLVEEVHVRNACERETVTEAVSLRRQRAVVERTGPEGGRTDDGGSAPVPPPGTGPTAAPVDIRTGAARVTSDDARRGDGRG